MTPCRVLGAMAAASLGGCLLMPDVSHWNGVVNHANLDGRTRAEVLADLGPPTALLDDRSAFLYALPDNDWVIVVAFWFVGGTFRMDPHWDVRFVRFDSRGVVRVATPKEDRTTTLDELVEQLAARRWEYR